MSTNDGGNPFSDSPDPASSDKADPPETPGPESPFNAYMAPQDIPVAQVSGQPPSDGVSKLIPYKNPPALVAYYLGLFSLLPCLGLFAAVPALVLGIIGLRRRQAQPEIAGSVHAWIGIILGAIFTVVWSVVIGMALLAGIFYQ